MFQRRKAQAVRAVTVHDDSDQSLDDDRLRMVRAMTDIFRARPARVPIQEQTLAPSVIASVKAKKGKFAAHAERKWSIAFSLRLHVVWLPSELNPADYPSRNPRQGPFLR